MNRLRTLIICAALALMALGTAGCGAGTVGSVGLYTLGHTRFARQHPSLTSAARCGYHSYRLAHDLRNHHHGWGALQGYWTAKNCSRAVTSR